MELDLSLRGGRAQDMPPLPDEFTLNGEVFRSIPNTHNKLAVSERGSVVGKSGKKLKPRKQSSGYQWFCYRDLTGAYHNIYAHRAVALAWIPNPLNKPYVNHKDGNKHNNTVTNLEWVTAKENTVHAIKKGLVTNLPEKGQSGFQRVKAGKELRAVTQAMINEQGGVCPVCGLRLLLESAVADHDHDTGLIRGALHRGCNGYLGKVHILAKRFAKATGREEQTAETMLNAAYYLMDDQYPLYYPSHKTEAEKRAARNKTARARYALKKKE